MLPAKIAIRLGQRKPSAILKEIFHKAPGYLRGIPRWQLRTCRCCLKISLFLASGHGSEFVWCTRCGANLRYELLAQEIRDRFGPALRKLRIVEFDPCSPLRTLLSESESYTRTFFSESVPRGQVGMHGARCEDIIALTFPDSSIDLMISSDVLEHVMDLEGAFRETARVLVPGGVHLFTAPYRQKTRPRVTWNNGRLIHLAEPEYHSDPLNEKGILAVWDIGPDLAQTINTSGLALRICRGPEGPDRRVVWAATKENG